MFLALGVGAFAAGIFHLYTHAFFKALLFLGSGAVIHALHGEQDIRQMGGLKKELPITYWTFLIGAAGDRRRAAAVRLLQQGRDPLPDRSRSGHTVLWVDRRADVAADGDLHVPAGLPDVPRRARRSDRPRATGTTPRSRHARRATAHGTATAAPARRAAGDGDGAARPGRRLGRRRLRRRAARARRQQHARELARSGVHPTSQRWPMHVPVRCRRSGRHDAGRVRAGDAVPAALDGAAPSGAAGRR